jgi:hypothetical protein
VTTTIPHLVNRFVIDTDADFEDVRQRYESLIPTIDFAELTEVVRTGDLERRVHLSMDQLSSRFASFGDPRIGAVGAALDAKLAAILRLMGLPVPPELEKEN